MKPNSKRKVQLTWGLILLLAGVSVFVRVPYATPKMEQISQFSGSIHYLKFCFYFIGTSLIGGGIRKIYAHFKKDELN